MDTAALIALLFPLALALLDWVAVARRWRRIGYFTKPGVIFALLAWLWAVTGFEGPAAWFAIGLLFSAAGDILLMLPGERLKVAMAAFMLALACYTLGFNILVPPEPNLPGLLIVLLVALTSQQLARWIAAGLPGIGVPLHKLALVAYLVLISVMLISALLTLVQPAWETSAALACSAGGLLFYYSDTVLQARHRLVTPAPAGRVWRRATYQGGQILLILGIALQYA